MKEQTRAFLIENSEEEYREFSKGLVPGDINMLGIRLPLLRKSKRVSKG